MTEVDQTDSAAQLQTLRHLVSAATARLLGNTIAVSDEQWRAPSRLPEWSRAHVATHLARQADALTRLIDGARTGQPTPMYPAPGQREAEIAAGVHRPGLELQIDLDTSAERLDEAFAALEAAEAWDAEVELRGGQRVRAGRLPLARLTEVVLHHVDLDVGFEVDDIDVSTADWLLEWCAFRIRSRTDFPRLALTSDSGATVSVGSAGELRTVRGSSPRLLGWLTGRAQPTSVFGSENLVLPAF